KRTNLPVSLQPRRALGRRVATKSEPRGSPAQPAFGERQIRAANGCHPLAESFCHWPKSAGASRAPRAISPRIASGGATMNAAAWSLYLTALALTGLVATTVISRASVTAPHAFADLRAAADPELVERGRYLVYGPAHCASCHGDPARERDLREGVDAPLSGGRAFILGMLGTIVAPNITSDAAFGIGEVSDHALVRSLRYGISRHGKPLVPIMSFADLADD